MSKPRKPRALKPPVPPDPVALQALEEAIELAGGVSKLSRAIGVDTPQVVANWRRRGVPAEYCAAVERAVDRKVTRARLHPRLFGDLVAREAALNMPIVSRETSQGSPHRDRPL